MSEQEILTRLREAFRGRNLTLYLGAGVSAESRVPTWDALVAAMYFSAVYADQRERRRHPFPNSLRAVAEWYLKRLPEPLEIVAQKVRQHHRNHGTFLESLRENLYPTLLDPETQYPVPITAERLRAGNRTLDAVASLAETKFDGQRGVRAVVTYNFDSLLEMALASLPHQPLWGGEQKRERGKLPVFHVHGYVPLDHIEGGSGETELIFSEDQYHAAAQDAYSWTNVVQLKYMSGSTGLMVGLSATDRNMRRLLDAVRKTPVRSQSFVLLQRPRWASPTGSDLDAIHRQALDYRTQLAGSGVEPRDECFPAMEELLARVEAFDLKQHERLLKRLGVVVVWYDEHSEVPDFLARITEPQSPSVAPTSVSKEQGSVPPSLEATSEAGRYVPLAQYLRSRPAGENLVSLTFTEVEKILGCQLPHSAKRHKPWWANDQGSHVQSREWLGAGWRVAKADLAAKVVFFSRTGNQATCLP